MTTEQPYDKQLDVADTDRVNAIKLESAKQQVSTLERKAVRSSSVKDMDANYANTDGKTINRNSGSKSTRKKSPFSSLDDLYNKIASNTAVSFDEQPPAPNPPTDKVVATPKKKSGRPKKNPTPC